MIQIRTKNAQASEGKARIDEMSGLKQPKASTSNRKILGGLGSIFAVIVYMRSFWSADPAQAHAPDDNLREDAKEDLQICKVPDISEWRAEMARAVPGDKPTRLDDPEAKMAPPQDRVVKVDRPGFFLQDIPVVTLPPLTGPAPAVIAPFRPPGTEGGGANGPVPVSQTPPTGAGGPSAPVAPGGPGAPGTPVIPDPEPEPEAPTNPTNPGDPAPVSPDPDPTTPAGPGPEPEPEPEPCEAHSGSEADCGGAGDCDLPPSGAQDPVADCDTCADADSMDADSMDADCADADGQEAACADAACAQDEGPSITRSLLLGSLLADALFGGDDAEELLGLAGADRIDGAGGDDILIGGTGDDDLAGGDGNDVLLGDDDDDRMHGGAGDDLLRGGAGSDALSGGDGDDRLTGDDGDDILHDGRGRDVLLGGLGDDTIHLFADGEVDFVDGGDGFDRLDLTAAQTRSHTDIALGELRIDDGPADLVVGIEAFVAGTAADEFDFSGLVSATPDGDGPMFFQITDFGRGDTVRLTESFAIGFDDLAEDGLWTNTPDTVSELELRMREASGDTAEAVPSRLSFRTATEEGMVARVIDFDLDGDGQVDLALSIQGDLPENTPQFPDQA